MAIRCELFSANFVPGSGDAESNRAVPLAAKILISGNPRPCRSLVFDSEEEIAIIADYDCGVEKLMSFLDRAIPIHPAIVALKEEAKSVLNSAANRNSYLVLDAGEIFSMSYESLADGNLALLKEVRDLEPQIGKAISEIESRVYEETHPPGFFARLLGVHTPIRKQDSKDLIESLGIGGWTDKTFYVPRLG